MMNIYSKGLSRLMDLKLWLKDGDKQVIVISSWCLRRLQEVHSDLRALDKQYGPPTNSTPINVVFDLSNETAYGAVLNQVRTCQCVWPRSSLNYALISVILWRHFFETTYSFVDSKCGDEQERLLVSIGKFGECTMSLYRHTNPEHAYLCHYLPIIL